MAIRLRESVLILTLCAAATGVAAKPVASPPPVTSAAQLKKIVVSGTPLPVPGFGLPLYEVPANIQIIRPASIGAASATLPDLLARDLANVHIGNGQNNPFQPDLSFRGFNLSPILGTPEALSVYLDGVRINEPFGDVVNFDLIPLAAIESVTLVPGSNPVYGLNTLAGSLLLKTKSGFDFPGLGAKLYAGSFDTQSAALEYGGHSAHYGWYVAADHYDSAGWATHNPSRVNQLFTKMSYRGHDSSLDLSFTGARSHLEGQQTLPLSFLDDPDQAYTYPDYFDNRLAFLTLNGRHRFDKHLALVGNVYNRVMDSHAFDSDVNDDFDPGKPVSRSNSPSVNDLSDTHEHGYGASLELVNRGKIMGRGNRLVIGASANLGDTDFNQSRQPAVFVNRDSVGFAPAEPRTRLHAHNRYYGVYLTDTLDLPEDLALSLSARYNRAHIVLEDERGTALSGIHDFDSFDPAIGLAWHPSPAITTWIAYNEGSRAPTPAELTCADPTAPCSLPNGFISDPSLKQVHAKTWDLGARGKFDANWSWNAALFRTDLDDDLLFISLNGLEGFYRNVPGDRRQGLEFGVHGTVGKFTLGANYSFTDASYLSSFTESSPSNSSAGSNGLVTVMPGDWIPAIPRQMVKLSAKYNFTTQFSLGAQFIAQTNQYARGDENNKDKHGPVPGFGVVNLDAHYRPAPRWDIFLDVANLFDNRHATLGQLGDNVFTGPDHGYDPEHPLATQFRAVAAPRSIQIGFRYGFGAD